MQSSLLDIMNVIGGGTPKTSVKEYWNGDIPWLSVADFNNDNKHVFSSEKSITTLGLENSSTKILHKGDIIISARGTIGALAVVTRDMAFNQSCFGLRAKPEFCNEDFLYYLIKFKINELKHQSHGSVFDTITRETFSKIKINIPSINKQKKIAMILAVIDDKIELNNSIILNLEEQLICYFKNRFSNQIHHANIELKELVDVIDNRGKTPPLIDNSFEFKVFSKLKNILLFS